MSKEPTHRKCSQDAEKERLMDQRVKKLLDKMKNRWRPRKTYID